jgi:GNAT superfamily N-acetyltransferase
MRPALSKIQAKPSKERKTRIVRCAICPNPDPSSLELFVSQISSACASLGEALLDDPFYRAVTVESGEDEERRQRVLAQYFELAIAEADGIGEVRYAGADGAAIWHTNEAHADDAAAYVKARKQGLAALLGDAGFGNYLRISESMAEHAPPHLADAWYLSILGVRPAARGRGLAQHLIEMTLRRADLRGATCFLETFNPLSLPFYQRLGFKDEIRCFERVTGRDYWILTRHAVSPT